MRILLFLTLFRTCITFGQAQVAYTNACSVAPDTKQECNKIYTLSYDEEKNETRKKLFQSILSVAGIKTGLIRLVLSNETNFAKYLKADTVAYIAYNQLSFHNKQDWQFMGVIAHELGHYINHHNDLCGRKDLEIDADYYVGFLLRRLGASNIEMAYSCLDLFPDSQETDSHPSKDKRKIAIKNGWDNSTDNATLSSFASQNPRIIWYVENRKLVIEIDERKVKPSIWNSNGVCYDKTTNSTIQLMNFEKEKKGIGKLINNRTEITFMRTQGNKFKIYRNGEIIPECDPPKWDDKDIDLMVKCYDPTIKRPAQFVLKDYYYSNYGVLMPAFSK